MEIENPPPPPFSTAAASTQTVTASPYTYQNASNQRQQVVISGGTVLTISISRDGTTFILAGVLAGTFLLNPGDYLRMTYVAVPIFTVFAL